MSDIYMKYVGKDKGTIAGVPARDLTFEEAQKYGIEILIKSGLYESEYITIEDPEKVALVKKKQTTKKRRVKNG